MNLFDRNSFDVNAYGINTNIISLVKTNKLIYKFYIVILGLFLIGGMIIESSAQYDDSFARTKGFLLALIPVGIILLVRSIKRIQDNKKIKLFGNKELFDLYLYQYHTARNIHSRMAQICLVMMAKCDIEVGNYERAGNALSLVEVSRLSGYYKKLYSLLVYIIKLFYFGMNAEGLDQLFINYRDCDISADGTFPSPEEVWNWKFYFDTGRISNVVNNIKFINDKITIPGVTFEVAVVFVWIVGYGLRNLVEAVPIYEGKVFIYYVGMIILSILQFVAVDMIKKNSREYVEKKVLHKYNYTNVVCVIGLLRSIWLFLVRFGDYWYYWM